MKKISKAISGHMFVCVHLDEDQEDTLCIETTMVGSASFAKAVSAGNDHPNRLFSSHASAHHWTN